MKIEEIFEGLRPVSVKEITNLFHDCRVFADPGKIVKGATVKEIKAGLRGKVPQSQPKFMDMMHDLGFKSEWSNKLDALVIYKG